MSVSPAGSVLVRHSGPVTTVTINRPEVRNAVDRQTAQELFDAFCEFDRDDAAAVAVLTGAGDHFCAGADLRAIAAGRGNRLQPDGPGPMGPTRLELSKPVIAAVSGFAVAGGLELALWCDLRVADESAVFGVFCRRWGVPLIDGGTVRLPEVVGFGVAMDLILTGRAVAAEEAKAIGLANRVVPSGAALQAAQELAESLAQLPQECLRSDRLALRSGRQQPHRQAMIAEFERGMMTISATGLADVARFKGVP